MSLTKPITRRRVRAALNSAADNNGPAERPEVVLERLTLAIAAIQRWFGGGAIPPIAPPVDAFDSRGEDDNHVYLWLNLPDRIGPDVDINVHETTLMIRLAKKRSAT